MHTSSTTARVAEQERDQNKSNVKKKKKELCCTKQYKPVSSGTSSEKSQTNFVFDFSAIQSSSDSDFY